MITNIESKSKFKHIFLERREMGVLLGLIVLLIFFGITSDTFFTSKNLINVLRQVSFVGILAMGMTFVIVCGEFDLSVGSVYCLSSMVCALMMVGGVPIWICCLTAVLVAAAVGVLNGFLVSRVRIPSFIATLGMLNVAYGVAMMISDGFIVTVNDMVVTDPGFAVFTDMGNYKIGGAFPVIAVIFICITIVAYFVYHKTIFGFRCRAVGGNADAAKVAGINVKKTKMSAFIIAATLAGFGGLLNLAFLHTAQGSVGKGLELDVISATIIGGASVSGGEGSIIGTVIGVLIMGFLSNGLVLIGVTTFLQNVCIGAVIIGSVAVDMWSRQKKY